MSSVRVRAHAKINWTLEVLGKRSDGYHEIRSIMQTIGIADTVKLHNATRTSLSLSGEAEGLTNTPQEENLAYRAATALSRGSSRAVRIELEKRIPVAAGLGGGSSDAAAVLRGLRALWQLDMTDEELLSIAAELGSDVPFFLHGGTALASGRGESIERLRDVLERQVVIAWKEELPRSDKTALMYSLLSPMHFTDGLATAAFAACIQAGEIIREQDIFNVFERVLNPEGHEVKGRDGLGGRGHPCGSGPAQFFLPRTAGDAEIMTLGIPTLLGMQAVATRTIGAAEATAIDVLD